MKTKQHSSVYLINSYRAEPIDSYCSSNFKKMIQFSFYFDDTFILWNCKYNKPADPPLPNKPNSL